MLPKVNRANKKTVEMVFKSGKFVNSTNLSFKYIKSQSPSFNISFIVPKKIAKKAVERNHLRRLGYIALEKHLNNIISGLIGVFIFKKVENNPLILENEIKNILHKIN